MARVNPKKPTNPDLPPEAVYRAKVSSAKEMTSSNGNGMFVLTLVDDDRRDAPLCEDLVMLDGKGWAIGKEKLIALGLLSGDQEIDILPLDFIGRVVFVAIKHTPEKWIGRDGDEKMAVKAKVDATTTTPWGGYWPENDPPPGYVPPSDDAPF